MARKIAPGTGSGRESGLPIPFHSLLSKFCRPNGAIRRPSRELFPSATRRPPPERRGNHSGGWRRPLPTRGHFEHEFLPVLQVPAMDAGPHGSHIATRARKVFSPPGTPGSRTTGRSPRGIPGARSRASSSLASFFRARSCAQDCRMFSGC